MSHTHSIYNKGANDGWKMGLYLTAMFLTQAASIYNPALSLIGAVMMLGIPFVAYILLRRAYVESHGDNTFYRVAARHYILLVRRPYYIYRELPVYALF